MALLLAAALGFFLAACVGGDDSTDEADKSASPAPFECAEVTKHGSPCDAPPRVMCPGDEFICRNQVHRKKCYCDHDVGFWRCPTPPCAPGPPWDAGPE